MKCKWKIVSVFLVVLFLVMLFPATAFAEFGTQDEVSFWVHAIEFTQPENPGFSMNDRGYIRPKIDADKTFYAPLNVPNGVIVTNLVLYYLHGPLSFAPIEFTFEWSVGNAPYGPIDKVSSSQVGYGTVDTGGETINNDHMYRLVVDFPEDLKEVGFKGVKVSYQRQISPAPSTESFNDVPVGYFFHQHIEALAASGITTGFSDGTFRPKEYVTREQMAAFLSRALGLHHP